MISVKLPALAALNRPAVAANERHVLGNIYNLVSKYNLKELAREMTTERPCNSANLGVWPVYAPLHD